MKKTEAAANRSVFLVAYHYPPIVSSGVERVVQFRNYLPEFGYDSRVLTTSAFGRDRADGVVRAWEPIALYRRLFNRSVRAGVAPSYIRTESFLRRPLEWLTRLLIPERSIDVDTGGPRAWSSRDRPKRAGSSLFNLSTGERTSADVAVQGGHRTTMGRRLQGFLGLRPAGPGPGRTTLQACVGQTPRAGDCNWGRSGHRGHGHRRRILRAGVSLGGIDHRSDHERLCAIRRTCCRITFSRCGRSAAHCSYRALFL